MKTAKVTNINEGNNQILSNNMWQKHQPMNLVIKYWSSRSQITYLLNNKLIILTDAWTVNSTSFYIQNN